MLLELGLTAATAVLTPINLPASTAPQHTYIEVIVKACPSAEITGSENKPDAVMGYYADPINQGVTYDNEPPPTRSEREAYFATSHCIDVPIPPEVTTSGSDGSEMTMAQCMGHRGYLTAMQYLEQNPAYAKSLPAVGMWTCVQHAFPATGVAGM
jgi:hypothetical protein